MLRPEDVTEDQIKAFLEGGTLAARIVMEMGIDKDPLRIRQYIASNHAWIEESAPFDAANGEAMRSEHHPRLEYRR